MIPVVYGITDTCYEALREIYGTDRAVWAAAYTHGKSLRMLAKRHRINPDA